MFVCAPPLYGHNIVSYSYQNVLQFRNLMWPFKVRDIRQFWTRYTVALIRFEPSWLSGWFFSLISLAKTWDSPSRIKCVFKND